MTPASPNSFRDGVPTDSVSTPLPEGSKIVSLRTLEDSRGEFTEVFRSEWTPELAAVQWEFVSSVRGSLRGMKVHLRHVDYVVLLRGHLRIVLRDLRPSSSTFRTTFVIDQSTRTPREAITIPAGIAHGFYFHERSDVLIGVTHYWDPADELQCRWDDPVLWGAWPDPKPDAGPATASFTLSELEERVALTFIE